MTTTPQVPKGDRARVSVLVRVPPETAFTVFTEEIDQWWRRGVRFRVAGNKAGIIHIEGHVGGRLLESFEVGSEKKIFETGKVTVWQPPSRLAFTWRGSNFGPSESTEVDITFEATASGTLVTVTHKGWSQLPPDHPARHRLEITAFVRMMGMWWGELLSALRQHAEAAEAGLLR